MTGPEFLFDFGSPNAYLAHRVLPLLERRTGARFRYVPVLLGGIFKATGNQSPMAALASIPSKLAYEKLEMRRFIERHGLTEFTFNPHFPVNTLQLMRGAVAAEQLSVFGRYVDVVFRAMWVDGLEMGDSGVFAAALQAAGLPAPALLRLAGDPGVKQDLADSTAGVVARGVFGIPTFFAGGEMFFGKDRLDHVEAALTGRPVGSA